MPHLEQVTTQNKSPVYFNEIFGKEISVANKNNRFPVATQ
jgi:hypothetical protein